MNPFLLLLFFGMSIFITMNHSKIIQQLAINADVLKAQLEGKSPEEYTFKPSPEKWCTLEVICHLVDEEREDFKARIRSVFENPDQELPGFNPIEWVSSQGYIEQNFEAKASEFLAERKNSTDWLRSLRSPKWQNAYIHSDKGPLSAEFFLANWLAHDYIHIRQINRLSFEYLQHRAEVNLDYAGNF